MNVAGHDDIQRLLGAYALDAVEGDEAELVARHVEICPRCRAELQEHREVAGLLGYAGQEAPAGLWDRISASMQEPPPALRLERVSSPAGAGPVGSGSGIQVGASRRRAGSLRGRAVAVLGVAAAVAIAVLGVQVSRLDGRTATIGHEVTAGAPSMAAVNVALSVPGARKVVLAPVSTGQTVSAVVLPGGQGYLYDAKLTSLPANRTYQLWGLTSGQAISYGILGNTIPQVVSFRAGDGVQALALTAEVAGGAEQPSRAPVASGGMPS
jgi:hypothetical protein